jgi:hypothetical protein
MSFNLMISLKAYSLDSCWLNSDIYSITLKLVGKGSFEISVLLSNVTLFSMCTTGSLTEKWVLQTALL